MKLKDLTGQKFGKLTVLKQNGKNKYGNALWLCKCDCGNEVTVRSNSLITGNTKSCGCYKKERDIESGKKYKKHGLVNTRLYNIWQAMKDRCYNKNKDAFYNYGGRGIKVCDDWMNDFKAFYDWAMANGYTDDLTIDRIDVNGNYCPENCRWATQKEQQRNRRNNKFITYKGETHCLSEWSEILNIPYDKFKRYIKKYSIDKIVNFS